MKRILPGIFVILFPYLLLLVTILLEQIHNTDLAFWILLLLFFIMTIVLVTSAIGTSIIFKSAIINFLTKFAYIPVHLLMILLFGAFMNPFLIFFSFIPFFITIFLQILTGIISLGTFIGNYRSKTCKLGLAITGSILSFFYIFDIIMAIIILIVNIVKSRTNKKS